MKIVKKAVKKVYRFNCPECSTRLEAAPAELVDMGNKISKFHCPVCRKDRHISWGELRKKTIYDDETED